LRPRARGVAGAGRQRRAVGDLAVPVRRGCVTERLSPSRALLPPLLATVSAIEAATAAQGGGARACDRGARSAPSARPPRPVARRARARRVPVPPESPHRV